MYGVWSYNYLQTGRWLVKRRETSSSGRTTGMMTMWKTISLAS